jgi:hypothetical protein
MKYYRRRLGHCFLCLSIGRHVEWLETAGEWTRAASTYERPAACPDHTGCVMSVAVNWTSFDCPASEASSRPLDAISIAVVVVRRQCQQCPPCLERCADPQGTLRHPSYGNPILKRSVRSVAVCCVSGTERCFGR